MEVAIKSIPKKRVAYMRHTGPYMECGKTFEKFCKWMAQKGLEPQKTVMYGLSWDDPETVPAERLRYDCCTEVGDDVGPEGDVKIQEIGGKEYASTIHKGPYENMPMTFHKLFMEWIPVSGREPDGSACVEIYHPEKMDMSKPESLETEICVPLK